MIEFIKNLFENKTFGIPRSPRWQSFRKDFIILYPKCQVCGTSKNLNAHHVIPFHLDTSLELSNDNLITLCESHHLWFGHFGSWKSWNKDVRNDATEWRERIINKP